MIKHKDDSYNRSLVLATEYADYVDWLFAQAKHETANFTSRLYISDNNMFGMTEERRPNKFGTRGTAQPKKDSAGKEIYYQRYNSDSESVLDMIEYLRRWKFPINFTTVERYVLQLKNNGFFGDSYENYLRGVKRFL